MLLVHAGTPSVGHLSACSWIVRRTSVGWCVLGRSVGSCALCCCIGEGGVYAVLTLVCVCKSIDGQGVFVQNW